MNNKKKKFTLYGKGFEENYVINFINNKIRHKSEIERLHTFFFI